MGFKKSITPQDVVDQLNWLLENDPPGCQVFMDGIRVGVNEKVAKHPSIQVVTSSAGDENNKWYTLGALGFLNGLFGTSTTGIGAIAMVVEGDGKVSKFYLTDPESVKEDLEYAIKPGFDRGLTLCFQIDAAGFGDDLIDWCVARGASTHDDSSMVVIQAGSEDDELMVQYLELSGAILEKGKYYYVAISAT